MTHRSGYGEIEATFRASEYGETLRSRVRYDKYRHPSISAETWVKLLGRDVSNLEHMPLTRGIALAFVRHTQHYQPGLLTDKDALVLPVAASIHDQGEAITTDISFGDKTSAHDKAEFQALEHIGAELYPEGSAGFYADAKEIVFDHEGETKLGDMFCAIEYLGYMRTALNAADLIENRSAPVVQVPGLQWLYTDVLTNTTVRLTQFAGKYDAVLDALHANAERIDRTFDFIDMHPEVFENYDSQKRQKMTDTALLARYEWEEFKSSTLPVSHVSPQPN